MALGYKFCSQCSHENFKHRCRSQEAAAVPYILPSLFLSGAAHLGCYESSRCECDGVPTPPSHHCHPPFPCTGLSFLFILVWIIIPKTLTVLFMCCVSWVTVCVCCRSRCRSSPPVLRLQLQFPSQYLRASSVLSLQCSAFLWVQGKASCQGGSRISLFSPRCFIFLLAFCKGPCSNQKIPWRFLPWDLCAQLVSYHISTRQWDQYCIFWLADFREGEKIMLKSPFLKLLRCPCNSSTCCHSGGVKLFMCIVTGVETSASCTRS